VGVSSQINPETGFLIDLNFLKKLVHQEIELYLDHKNLNIEVEEFFELNPTVENIAIVIWNKLRKKIDPQYDLTVTLYETPRNFVTYTGT